MLEMMGRLGVLKFQFATQEVVEDYNNDKIKFDDELMQSCIGANFTDEKIELLKICAERLMLKEEEYETVISFITLLGTMTDEYREKVYEKHDISEIMKW